MDIEKLDASTRSRLRSTQILTSLPHIVSELLQNSLDAGSSTIEIGLDAQEWMCWVKDNGHGISKQNLEVIGQENDSGRYATSKAYSQNLMNAETTFGFRGEALASTCELSCVEISSRTVHSKESYSVIMKGGKRLYTGPSVRWRRELPGTVVCVRDAFFNLPVRRLSHPSASKTWELIRQECETYALVSPGVSFAIEDLNTSKPSGDRVVRIPKASSSVDAFRRLFGRALVESVEVIDVSAEDMRIEGFISLVASHTKNHQHIYINRHPMDVGDLHRLTNSWFSQSFFARSALNENGESDLPGAGTRRSPRKAEKRPVYVLNIHVPPNKIDNCLEPSKGSVHLKDHNSVIGFLFKTVHNFLLKHGFSPNHIRHARSLPPAISDSPRKRRRLDPLVDLGPVEEDLAGIPASPAHRNTLHEEDLHPEVVLPEKDDQSDHVAWTDPKTGVTFIIDSRTGNSLGRATDISMMGRRTSSCGPPVRDLDRRTLRPVRSTATSGERPSTPDWLSRALKGNEVYRSADQPMVRAAHGCGDHMPSKFQHHFQVSTSKSYQQITRDHLQQAQVISQIDHKFIACLMASNPHGHSVHEGEKHTRRSNSVELLVLVDQHAADERIRVESFLRPLCTGFLLSRRGRTDPGELTPITHLAPPRPALLTRHEASLLRRNGDIQELLRRWGITFADMAGNGTGSTTAFGGNGDFEQVFVATLPEVVSDKLLQHNELQDLLKATIGDVESGHLTVDASYSTNDEPNGSIDWLPALRWCPRSLLELVNSKACRGAIMFNDRLTQEQCERLVSQLSQTAFPFQCAHGRPSLISLTDVNSIPGASQARRTCDWKIFEQ